MSGQHSGHGHHHGHAGPAATLAEGDLVTDPVCGMQVDPATSKHRLDHGGRTFHFCSAGCRTKFAAEPARYLQPQDTGPNQPPPRKGVIYTCPMHPQIRQEGPGNCPICGMALEPLEVSAEAGPNAELVDMTRRFWIGLALTLPIVVLEMGGHIPALGLHHLVSPGLSTWIQFLLGTPVVLWAGWPFFVRG
jgi:P-type Cu+ transporter